MEANDYHLYCAAMNMGDNRAEQILSALLANEEEPQNLIGINLEINALTKVFSSISRFTRLRYLKLIQNNIQRVQTGSINLPRFNHRLLVPSVVTTIHFIFCGQILADIEDGAFLGIFYIKIPS